ncbi:hypothetical protein LINGRAHAP2_LOCUS5655 [Linum grandiflorum]
MAEFHRLIESLDSLWFFSTVFDDPSSPIIPAAAKSDHQMVVAEPEKQSKADTEVKIPTFPEEETIKSPPAPPAPAEDAEVRVEVVVFESKPETAAERRKRLARRWRSKKKTVIVLSEVDLCFDYFYYKNYAAELSFASLYGFPAAERRKKMPALNDSLEMKRQLKSWAHAVACTVK